LGAEHEKFTRNRAEEESSIVILKSRTAFM